MLNGLGAQRDEHIAGKQAGVSRRAVGVDVFHQDALADLQAQAGDEVGGEAARLDTQEGPGHATAGAQGGVGMPDDIERHGESEPFAAAGLRQDHGVDAQQVAVEIYQRASRIAGVHGCVGLYVGPGIVGS